MTTNRQHSQTLEQRLAAGRVPVLEALRLAVQLGQALGHIDGEDHVFGSLSPDAHVLNEADSCMLLEADPAKEIGPHSASQLLLDLAPTLLSEMKALRKDVATLESRLVSQLERYRAEVAEVHRRFAEELRRQNAVMVQALNRSMEAEGAVERVEGQLSGLPAMTATLGTLKERVSAHSARIEANRAGLARTDDVMERVVEAVEALQGMVIDQSAEA